MVVVEVVVWLVVVEEEVLVDVELELVASVEVGPVGPVDGVGAVAPLSNCVVVTGAGVVVMVVAVVAAVLVVAVIAVIVGAVVAVSGHALHETGQSCANAVLTARSEWSQKDTSVHPAGESAHLGSSEGTVVPCSTATVPCSLVPCWVVSCPFAVSRWMVPCWVLPGRVLLPTAPWSMPHDTQQRDATASMLQYPWISGSAQPDTVSPCGFANLTAPSSLSTQVSATLG